MSLPEPGDFAVVRTHGWQAAVIRIATRSHYNHAFLYVWGDRIVEAAPGGAVCVKNHYPAANVLSSHMELTALKRYDICNKALQLVGVPYGWLDILSIGLLQYGIKPKFIRNRVQHSKDLICSQLVDFAYLLADVHLFEDGRLPMDVTPGDLARLIEMERSHEGRSV